MKKNFLKEIEALANAGKLDEAEKLALSTPMPPTTALTVSATLAMKRGEYQKAEVEFGKVLAAEPQNFVAAGNLASLLLNQKKAKAALPYAEQAYKAAPTNENFLRVYAAALSEVDRFAEALEVFKPLVDIEQPKLGNLISYASLLRACLQPDDALLVLERAAKLFPEQADAEKAIAEAYAEIDPHIAQPAFAKAEQRAPESVSLKWNASFVELRLRNFERGWQLYEHGLSDQIGRIGRPLPPQAKRLPMVTDLQSLDQTKWTLFTAEQGLGDQVLFLGCLEEALPFAPKAALIGEDRMVAILKRSFPSLEAYTYGFASGLAHQTHRINGVFPIGSLMKHFRNTEDTFVKHRKPYLKPNQARVEEFRKILTSRFPGQQLIGISWRGGYWDRQRRTKSFDFELFGRLMKRADQRFVALQYGDIEAERKLATQNGWPVTFIDGVDFKKNIDDWFSLACACDRIVSVSTALVHFAGAAGRRVDVLIGDYQAPFIWGLEEGQSLPYEHVFLHRKRKPETVEQFFDRIALALA